jgi:hypothetical protein
LETVCGALVWVAAPTWLYAVTWQAYSPTELATSVFDVAPGIVALSRVQL